MIILILPWWYTVQTSSKSRNYPAVWDKLFTIYSYSQMMCFLGLFIQPVCDLAHLVPIIPLLQPSLAATICTAPYGWTHQWHSQDEQLMWAQHEHIQWACNTHLLEGNGARFHHENFLKSTFWDHFWCCFWSFFQSYMYACFMSTWKQSHTGLWP